MQGYAKSRGSLETCKYTSHAHSDRGESVEVDNNVQLFCRSIREHPAADLDQLKLA